MNGPRTLIGIDPGKTGAIATLQDDQLIAVHDMPYLDGHVSAPHLTALLTNLPNPHAWVEQAQSMPNQGVASSFKYGVGYGVILGVLGALHIPTHHARPATWKRALTLTSDKNASRRRACDLWPDHAGLFARKKDDGRAEAALIALYGWHQGLRSVA